VTIHLFFGLIIHHINRCPAQPNSIRIEPPPHTSSIAPRFANKKTPRGPSSSAPAAPSSTTLVHGNEWDQPTTPTNSQSRRQHNHPHTHPTHRPSSPMAPMVLTLAVPKLISPPPPPPPPPPPAPASGSGVESAGGNHAATRSTYCCMAEAASSPASAFHTFLRAYLVSGCLGLICIK
jgi:hypothetical protein